MIGAPKKTLFRTQPEAGYRAHRAEIDEAVHRVLVSGKYILGEETNRFEEEFADCLQVGHVIGVASGTDALQLALRACGIGPGDGVITVSHTAVATVAAIELTGAAPILVDVEPGTYTLDPQRLEQGIRTYAGNAKLKAVVPVHLYGNPVDLPAIEGITERHGLYLIEDCAQAHGASWRDRRVGGWGHLSAFSFYPTKNLGAFGDGGAVCTNDPELADKVRLLRQYGWRQRQISECAGMNSRLDEIQAAILRVKLKYLDEENNRRRDLARLYTEKLAGSPWKAMEVHQSATPVYHQYVVGGPDRDALREFLQENGIGTAIHYPVPIHLQPAYRGRVHLGHGGLAVTENLCREILSLPMFPQLEEDEVDRIADLILEFEFNHRKKEAAILAGSGGQAKC